MRTGAKRRNWNENFIEDFSCAHYSGTDSVPLDLHGAAVLLGFRIWAYQHHHRAAGEIAEFQVLDSRWDIWIKIAVPGDASASFLFEKNLYDLMRNLSNLWSVPIPTKGATSYKKCL